MLFSIAPLAIVLVSVFGLVLQDDSVREDVVDAIVDHFSVTVAGGGTIEDAFTSDTEAGEAAGFVDLSRAHWRRSRGGAESPRRSSSAGRAGSTSGRAGAGIVAAILRARSTRREALGSNSGWASWDCLVDQKRLVVTAARAPLTVVA